MVSGGGSNVPGDRLKARLGLGSGVRAARLVSWSLLLAGLASLGYAGLQGELDVYLVLVVPVVAGSGAWSALGFLATIAGIAGLFWTSATRRMGSGAGRGPQQPPGARREESWEPETSRTGEPERETRGGGVILIGPIPIAWGSDRSTLGWLVAAGVLLTVAAVALTFVLSP